MYTVGENCPGCGKCIRGVCPTKAITMKSYKAVIGQECIDCGLCIPVCPINIIKKQTANQPENKQKVTSSEINTVKEVETNGAE